MPSASHDLSSRPVRLLVQVALAGLAAITLVDRGAARMYSTPWHWVLAAVITAPVVAVVLRAFSAVRPLRLPARAWLMLAGAVAAIPVVSALLSPYRGMSLLSAAIPVSAAAVFLLVHDWLAGCAKRNRLVLMRTLAGAFALVTVASFAQWLGELASVTRDHDFATVLAVWRNPHPLGHSNYTAGLMLLGLPWLLRTAWRACGWRRGAALAGAALVLLNLFTSGSRGGLLGLAALGAGALLVARLGWKRLGVAAVGIVAIVLLLAVANPRIRSLLGPPDPAAEPNASSVQRAAMFRAGLLMGEDHPLLGWGPGTTPLVYPRYRAQLEGGIDTALQLHSTPVNLWAETGAAGLLGALALALLVLKHRQREPFAAITLMGYGVFALTDYQCDIPFFAAAVATLAAMLASPAPAPATPGARRLLAGGALAVIALIALLGRRDPVPLLNVEALTLGREAAGHDRAVALLQQSLVLNPDQELAHFNLGWLLAVPDPAAAEQHFLAAAHLVPPKGGVYFGLGLARLNQGKTDAAARALALECINDPLFLASPWWRVPEIAALRDRARAHYESMVFDVAAPASSASIASWPEQQAAKLQLLAARLGQPSAGPEIAYRRSRAGYPVLMRNLDFAPPDDLYDVREDPRFPDSVPFPLPNRGWLPSPRLLNLLDAPAP